MPLYTREPRASPRRDSSRGFINQNNEGEPCIVNSFGDTLQTVDDLWRPPYTVKTSIPSANMRSRADSGVLPRMDIDEHPPSYYNERSTQPQMSKVNSVSANSKGVPRAERSESRSTQSPTEWMSESGGSTFSRSSIDSPDASLKIARRALPARKPLPPSKRSSASSVMGNKGSKSEASHRDSSRAFSAQQSPPPPDAVGRDPTPASSSATITTLEYTPAGSWSLREEFERRIPDEINSREAQMSSDRKSAINGQSVLARSHSRDKSNTALHILNSFPMVQKNGIPKNMDVSRHSPKPSAHTPLSPPAVPLHTNFQPSTAVPPLTRAHHHCYHSHRSMQLSRNVYAPLPCMTCYREDQEPRWKCSWCCLRICRQCLEHLENSRERTVSDILRTVRKRLRVSEGGGGYVSAP